MTAYTDRHRTDDPPAKVCGFCNGEPVGDAARWLDGKPRPPLPCPRCGVLTPYDRSEHDEARRPPSGPDVPGSVLDGDGRAASVVVPSADLAASRSDLQPPLEATAWRGVYGAMCRDPELCRGRGSCPRDPSCCE